jgi:hypothetical protein
MAEYNRPAILCQVEFTVVITALNFFLAPPEQNLLAKDAQPLNSDPIPLRSSDPIFHACPPGSFSRTAVLDRIC